MATKDKYEENEIALGIGLKSGKGKPGEQATFKFTAKDPAGTALTLDPSIATPAPVEVEKQKGAFKRGSKASITFKPPKVSALSKTINFYDLSYTYKVGENAEVPGKSTYRIWPQKVQVKLLKKGTTDALPGAEVRIAGEKSGTKTNDAGIVVLTAPKYKEFEVEIAGGYTITSWKQQQGTEREAEADFSFECKIAAPTKPTSGKLKQWVNLKAGTTSPPNSGSVLEVEVGPKGDASQAKKDDVVFVECTFTKTGKRTAPKPQLLAEGVTSLVEADGGKKFTGQVKIKKDGGRASFKVDLGKGGGETWTIKVGRTASCADDTLEVETWRRLYVQVQRAQELTALAVDAFRTCMREVFIEPGFLKEQVLKPDAAPGKGLLVWMDGEHLGKTKGKKHLLAGDTSSNGSKYEKVLDSNAALLDTDKLSDAEKAPNALTASIILCDEQVDFTAGSAVEIVDADTSAMVTLTKGGGGKVTKVELEPKDGGAEFYAVAADGTLPVSAVAWKVEAEEGTFDIDDVTVTFTEADGPKVTIDTSADTDFQDAVDAHAGGDFVFYLGYESADVFNGEAFGDRGRHLLVSGRFKARPAAEVCGTMAHELGHAMNMCLADDYAAVDVAAARTEHERHYQKSGDHCAFGLAQGTYDTQAGSDWDDHSATCKCVMYGVGGSDRSNSYCEKCKPYFIAHEVAEFTKTR
jgi:hypothetical protein